MHPEVVKSAPGKCPKCGMDLVLVKDSKKEHVTEHQHHEKTNSHVHDHGAGGHAHHEGMIEDFKKRFYVVLILTLPIMGLSPMIQQWLGVDWQFTGSNNILLILSSVVFLYGGGLS